MIKTMLCELREGQHAMSLNLFFTSEQSIVMAVSVLRQQSNGWRGNRWKSGKRKNGMPQLHDYDWLTPPQHRSTICFPIFFSSSSTLSQSLSPLTEFPPPTTSCSTHSTSLDRGRELGMEQLVRKRKSHKYVYVQYWKGVSFLVVGSKLEKLSYIGMLTNLST